jgi:hypothetical protein
MSSSGNLIRLFETITRHGGAAGANIQSHRPSTFRTRPIDQGPWRGEADAHESTEAENLVQTHHAIPRPLPGGGRVREASEHDVPIV